MVFLPVGDDQWIIIASTASIELEIIVGVAGIIIATQQAVADAFSIVTRNNQVTKSNVEIPNIFTYAQSIHPDGSSAKGKLVMTD